MKMTEQDLLNLKDRIEEAKSAVSELKGQQIVLMKQLLDNWNCKNIEEAKIKLRKMEKDIEVLEQKIEKGIRELEEKYNIE